ncbi:YbjN domain-containing protein [Aquabacter spiritensis]|uniref:Putative sensory transduction regulator n=1 Tax=Aquabacter spiritensis TaxID=933073 RepID=A0A4R3M541_9HYPH|nr:YbjN domain-containing protein [Aquabacter spiritensis]TCT06547.1 putative sensory transduction regulator [Aquabacter spiritensis]
MDSGIRTVTADSLAAVLNDRGFRAEKVDWTGGREALKSATSGVVFHLVLGNGAKGAYHDFTYFTSFRLEGLSLEDICSDWNRGRRFARLHTRDGLLNMEMDVILGTGVQDGYLAVTLELWNQLLNELISALREEAARLSPAAATPAAAN